MSIREWFSNREPAPPANLAARLVQLLEEDGQHEATPEAFVQVSARLIERLVRRGETSRASALELLAADALATYAFELEGSQPERLDATCGWAMRHLSGSGERGAA